MQTFVSIDLKLTDNPVVSVFDRSFLFGDSVYEMVRTYEGKLFTFEEHFERLARSAELIYMRLPFSGGALRKHLEEMAARVGKPNCYIRIVVSRGVSELSIEPPQEARPTTVVYCKQLKEWPVEDYQKGVALVVPKVRRNPRAALNPMIKSGNYLNSVLAIYQARQAGVQDAVLLNPDGEITESTTSNVFFVKGGKLYTPPMESGILDGITRTIILQLAQSSGIDCIIEPLHYDDLSSFAECFISSTSRELMPVNAIDNLRYATPGKLTGRLSGLFSEFVQRRLRGD